MVEGKGSVSVPEVEEKKVRTLGDVLRGDVSVSRLALESIVMYVAAVRELNGDPYLPPEIIERNVTTALRGDKRVYP